jgi:predicted small lipoprotein YifL
MRRFVTMLLAVVVTLTLVVGCLAGCGKKTEEGKTPAKTTTK